MSTRPSPKLPDERLIHVWPNKHAFAKNPLQAKACLWNRHLLRPFWSWIYVVGRDTVQPYPSQQPYLIRPGAVRRKLLEVIASTANQAAVDGHVI